MKKIVGIMAAAALATSAFAVDVGANVQAKMGFAKDKYGWMEDQIGTDNLLSVNASSDVAGAEFNIRAKEAGRDDHNDNDRVLFVDSYNVWIKPVEQLKLTMGTGADFSIFGDGIGKGDGKIGIVNDGTGLKAEVTPVDALWIGARVDAPADNWHGDVDEQLKFAVGASYTVDGVGKFGGEFAREGNNAPAVEPKAKWNAFMVGADITAVENLDVKLDFAGWLGNKKAYNNVSWNAYKVGAFVTYTADALTIQASERAIIRSGDFTDKKKVPAADKQESFSNIVCAKVGYSINAFAPYVSAAFATNLKKIDDQYQGKVNAVNAGNKDKQFGITVGTDYKVGAATVNVEFSFNKTLADKGDDTDSWELPIAFKYAF